MRSDRYIGSLDELETDVIVVTLFETERPPLGVSGLIDWRLNGFLSRMIIAGTIEGKENELVLIPLHKRLLARRVLILGLGKPEQFFLSKARHVAFRLGKTLSSLSAIDVGLSFPAAMDERVPGDTERSVFDALGQASLPANLFLHWLVPPIKSPLPSTNIPSRKLQSA